MTFEDYCSELGLSEDSRQAKQTYDAIRAMAPKLEAFFGDELAQVVKACEDY